MTTKYEKRISHVESILLINNRIIDMGALREACTFGTPEQLRPICWRLFLNFLPKERIDWPQILSKRREEYRLLVENLIATAFSEADDHPLADSHSEWSTYFKDNEVLSQIDKDVRRLRPEIDFFQRQTHHPFGHELLTKRIHASDFRVDGKSKPAASTSRAQLLILDESDEAVGETHWQVVERILFIFSKVNAGVKYVQGMNEICGPIYFVLASDSDEEWSQHAEADAFFCFQSLMSEIKDNFIRSLDTSNCGIESTLTQFHARFAALDSQLYAHVVDRLNIKPQYYAFKWLSLLFSQEFSLPDVIALWDSLLASADIMETAVNVGLAMLVNIRDELLAGDFGHCVRLLQNYPFVSVNELTGKAIALRDSQSTASNALFSGDGLASQFWKADRFANLGGAKLALSSALSGAKDRLNNYAQSARRQFNKNDI